MATKIPTSPARRGRLAGISAFALVTALPGASASASVATQGAALSGVIDDVLVTARHSSPTPFQHHP